MAENRNCFTFIWRIKNYSLAFSFIVSPDFFVHEMGGSKWRLHLLTNDYNSHDYIYCTFDRGWGNHGPDELKIDYELSFVNSNGSVLHSEMHREKIRKKNLPSLRCSRRIEEVKLYKNDLLIPDDTLTIHCRMWSSEGSISHSSSCFAETRIERDFQYVVGTIEKFSTIESKEEYAIHQKSSSKEKFLSYINLCVKAAGVLYIDIQPITRNYKKIRYRCKILVLDKFQNKVNFGQGLFRDEMPHRISLGLSKEYLMEKKEYFLPNDELTIRCEMTVNSVRCFEGLLGHEGISEIEYILNCKDTNRMLSYTRVGDVSSEKYSTENLTTLKDDWLSILRDTTLCDTKLKTATETFCAHKIVLSARSPVFKSMFTTDMREKTNKCVEIDDIDADTVRRMLLFMYSDTLNDLEYESAKPLYSAADKYNIVSLRQRCSNFLKQNLSPSNCCDILVLADRHQDEDLKNAAQYYVSENDEAVLSSEEWKNMEKYRCHLTIEVFRFIYMKNRRK